MNSKMLYFGALVTVVLSQVLPETSNDTVSAWILVWLGIAQE